MAPILIIGIILFTGFIAGEVCARIRLPKVTGYIIAGLLLNPGITHFIPESFVTHTSLVTNIALSFITFSVGGTLLFPKIRSLGKSIIFITLLEAEFAFIFVGAAFIVLAPLMITQQFSLLSYFVPIGLLLAAMASPTDPSATLAVEHEYNARGDVTSTIMGVAAFDDILGIINFSLAVAAVNICMTHQALGLHSVLQPILRISVSVITGAVFGLLLNVLTKIIKKDSEGVLITLIISFLALCYGSAGVLGADELLATMVMGIIVVNFNKNNDAVFSMLERYTEELIFVLFFTISAMHLDFSVLVSNYLFILMFVIFRSAGKYCGTFLGGKISRSSAAVQKYTAGGLIPQGGIVIGLALIIKQNPAFSSVSDIILNVVIGATIIHEIIGPVISKLALEKAGEIKLHKKKV